MLITFLKALFTIIFDVNIIVNNFQLACQTASTAPTFRPKLYIQNLIFPYLKTLGLRPLEKIQPTKLSLGQKQLLAGVRACYLKKNVVFFDEISSALDSELEFALRKCILIIQEFSLTIIVAHRVETIIAADKILVMEKGRLIQSGSHKELLESKC